jgi:fibronectin type 3 domain-containing protein
MKIRGLYVLLFVLVLLFAIVIVARRCGTEPHSVTLTWQAPRPRDAIAVVGYNVYRRTNESSSFSKIADKVKGPPYEDLFVSSGRSYFYVVTSVDNIGRESRFSEEATAEIP